MDKNVYNTLMHNIKANALRIGAEVPPIEVIFELVTIGGSAFSDTSKEIAWVDTKMLSLYVVLASKANNYKSVAVVDAALDGALYAYKKRDGENVCPSDAVNREPKLLAIINKWLASQGK